MQPVEHVAWSAAHAEAQCPSAQTWLAPQAEPQPLPDAEQYVALAVMSTQVPPQYSIGAPPKHVVPQVPPLQPVPVGQAWLQEPQFAESVSVSTHTPLHAVVPPWHVAWHVAVTPEPVLEQSKPEPHVVPHVPQLCGSFDVRTHAPLHGVPALAQSQWPSRQISGEVHVVPHVPQLSGSVFVFVQVVPPHSEYEPEQLAAQVPPLHTSPEPQLVPQVPQLWRSVSSSTQDPLHAVSGNAQVGGALSGAASCPPVLASLSPIVASGAEPSSPLDEVPPEEVLPEDAPPEELAPDDELPEELAPEEPAADDELPEELTPEDPPFDELTPDEAPPSPPFPPGELIAPDPPHAASTAQRPTCRTFPWRIEPPLCGARPQYPESRVPRPAHPRRRAAVENTPRCPPRHVPRPKENPRAASFRYQAQSVRARASAIARASRGVGTPSCVTTAMCVGRHADRNALSTARAFARRTRSRAAGLSCPSTHRATAHASSACRTSSSATRRIVARNPRSRARRAWCNARRRQASR